MGLLRVRRPRGTENPGDSGSVCLPSGGFSVELALALGGKPVVLCLAVVFGEAPLGVEEAFAFETPKGRIKSAFFEKEHVVTVAANCAGNGVAVQWTPDHCLEDKYVESSAKKFEFSVQ